MDNPQDTQAQQQPTQPQMPEDVSAVMTAPLVYSVQECKDPNRSETYNAAVDTLTDVLMFQVGGPEMAAAFASGQPYNSPDMPGPSTLANPEGQLAMVSRELGAEDAFKQFAAEQQQINAQLQPVFGAMEQGVEKAQQTAEKVQKAQEKSQAAPDQAKKKMLVGGALGGLAAMAGIRRAGVTGNVKRAGIVGAVAALGSAIAGMLTARGAQKEQQQLEKEIPAEIEAIKKDEQTITEQLNAGLEMEKKSLHTLIGNLAERMEQSVEAEKAQAQANAMQPTAGPDAPKADEPLKAEAPPAHQPEAAPEAAPQEAPEATLAPEHGPAAPGPRSEEIVRQREAAAQGEQQGPTPTR